MLDQRHREQSTEARTAKSLFMWSLLSACGFMFLAAVTSPAYNPQRVNTFFGTFLSLMFLMSMAGTYVSALRGVHNLSILRLPSAYGGGGAGGGMIGGVGGGLGYQFRFLLPSDHGRSTKSGIEYAFYASFVLACTFGFAFPSFFLFVVMMMVFCGTFAVHTMRLYS